MLGVGYALVSASIGPAPLATTGGAVAAIALLYLAHDRPAVVAPLDARGAVRASALHSASEGVAIGAAVTLGASFGLVLALALVVHNVSEGAVLGVALRDEGRSVGAAARAATLARAAQVALALATHALLVAVPAALPWALGAGFGALLFLLFAELLPESYVGAGRTGIAVAVSLAAGIVALLGSGARGLAP